MKVFVTEPLLTPAQVAASNLLKVTLEAAYSVPESFMPVGPQQNYMVGLQVPSVGEVKPHLRCVHGLKQAWTLGQVPPARTACKLTLGFGFRLINLTLWFYIFIPSHFTSHVVY